MRFFFKILWLIFDTKTLIHLNTFVQQNTTKINYTGEKKAIFLEGWMLIKSMSRFAIPGEGR